MTDATVTPVGDDTQKTPQPSLWLSDARQFVAAVEKICLNDNGARAALRRGEGKTLDHPGVRGMHKFIASRMPPTALHDEDAQQAYYTVAAMIAAQRRDRHSSDGQPDQEPSRNTSTYGRSLGLTFAAAVGKGTQDGMRESAAEERLNLLTRQSIAGLHRHLPATVRQLCGKQCPPDWARLLVDLRNWPRQRGRIGRRWLQDFYRDRRAAELEAARTADPQPASEPAAEEPA